MNRKYRGVACALIVFLLIAGCGLREGVYQPAQRSYLWFTGDTGGAQVYIDDLEPFSLRAMDNPSPRNEVERKDQEVRYEVRPGKHRIVVKKGGVAVVDRLVLIGDGAIKEIKVP